MACRRIVKLRRCLLLWPLVVPTRATAFRGYKARSQNGVDFSSLFDRISMLEPEADWFLHSSKELLLCGSPKAPDRRLSKLALQRLVELIAEK